jgi:hypothetical protein
LKTKQLTKLDRRKVRVKDLGNLQKKRMERNKLLSAITSCARHLEGEGLALAGMGPKAGGAMADCRHVPQLVGGGSQYAAGRSRREGAGAGSNPQPSLVPPSWQCCWVAADPAAPWPAAQCPRPMATAPAAARHRAPAADGPASAMGTEPEDLRGPGEGAATRHGAVVTAVQITRTHVYK